jgi:hypothetical protein
MHLLLEKLQVIKLSVGQGNMVTIALVRRGVGALITKALVALSTIYTKNNANHKHIAFINTHENKYACNM